MNFLDYLVNAMTGGQPTQQELIARKMAQEENKNQTLQGLLSPQIGAMPEPMKMTPEMIDEMRRNMTPPISGQGQTANQYKQNLLNPSMTMQQNYIDPKLIEMMYYKSLLNK
jgi:hypothetical protein